jgi:hypothetical protein
MLQSMDEYIGKYVSHQWVRKNILRQSDEEIEEMQKQIEEEKDGDENEAEIDF